MPLTFTKLELKSYLAQFRDAILRKEKRKRKSEFLRGQRTALEAASVIKSIVYGDDGDLVNKAFGPSKFDESKHPRGDDGRFISKGDISRAKIDPQYANELRNRVNNPRERAKLDKQIAGRGKLDVHETVGRFYDAKAAGFTDEHKVHLAERLTGHTREQLADVARHLNVQVSGNKADFVRRLILRAAGVESETQGFTGKIFTRTGGINVYEGGRLVSHIRKMDVSDLNKVGAHERMSVDRAVEAYNRFQSLPFGRLDDAAKSMADILMYRMTGREIRELGARLEIGRLNGLKADVVENFVEAARDLALSRKTDPKHPDNQPDPDGLHDSLAEANYRRREWQRQSNLNPVERDKAVRDAAERLKKALNDPHSAFSLEGARVNVLAATNDLIGLEEFERAATLAGMRNRTGRLEGLHQRVIDAVHRTAFNRSGGHDGEHQVRNQIREATKREIEPGKNPEPQVPAGEESMGFGETPDWFPAESEPIGQSIDKPRNPNHSHTVHGPGTYKNKEEIKALGGQWDGIGKQWYVDDHAAEKLSRHSDLNVVPFHHTARLVANSLANSHDSHSRTDAEYAAMGEAGISQRAKDQEALTGIAQEMREHLNKYPELKGDFEKYTDAGYQRNRADDVVPQSASELKERLKSMSEVAAPEEKPALQSKAKALKSRHPSLFGDPEDYKVTGDEPAPIHEETNPRGSLSADRQHAVAAGEKTLRNSLSRREADNYDRSLAREKIVSNLADHFNETHQKPVHEMTREEFNRVHGPAIDSMGIEKGLDDYDWKNETYRHALGAHLKSGGSLNEAQQSERNSDAERAKQRELERAHEQVRQNPSMIVKVDGKRVVPPEFTPFSDDVKRAAVEKMRAEAEGKAAAKDHIDLSKLSGRVVIKDWKRGSHENEQYAHSGNSEYVPPSKGVTVSFSGYPSSKDREYLSSLGMKETSNGTFVGAPHPVDEKGQLFSVGTKFESSVKSSELSAGQTNESMKWKKNEDGTYTAPNGQVWKLAAPGGEVSPVTGERYAGGRFMPIHGGSAGIASPEQPEPSGLVSDGAKVDPEKEKQKEVKPQKSPLTPEQIEEAKAYAEEKRKWAEMTSGPLGKIKWLGDRPNYKAKQDVITNYKDWKEYAEEVGPSGIKHIIDRLEPHLHAKFDSGAPDKESSEWYKGFVKNTANDDVSMFRGKGHEKNVPGSHYARQLIQFVLDHKQNGLFENPTDNMHALNQLLVEAKSAGQAKASEVATESPKAETSAVDPEVQKLRNRGMDIVDITDREKFLSQYDGNDATQPEQKSPHEMKLADFVAANLGDDNFAKSRHRAVVESQLKDGGSVPAEVLADYPDLAEKYGSKAESKQAETAAVDSKEPVKGLKDGESRKVSFELPKAGDSSRVGNENQVSTTVDKHNLSVASHIAAPDKGIAQWLDRAKNDSERFPERGLTPRQTLINKVRNFSVSLVSGIGARQSAEDFANTPTGKQSSYLNEVRKYLESERPDAPLRGSVESTGADSRNVGVEASPPAAESQPAIAPEPESQPIARTGYTLADHDAIRDRMNKGELTADELRAAHGDYVKHESAIKAEIGKRNVDQLNRLLLNMGSYSRSKKKSDLVNSIYRSMGSDFNPVGSTGMRTLSSMFGESSESALKKRLDSVTDEDLKTHADRYANEVKELQAKKEAVQSAIANPVTHEDFRQLAQARGGYDKLNHDEAAAYDDAMAAHRRGRDMAQRQEQAKVSGFSGGEESTGGINIVQGWHQKRGVDTHTVTVEKRLGDKFDDALRSAKRLGGTYVNEVIARRYNATPGFQFFDKAAAEQFADVLRGKTVDRSANVEEEMKDRVQSRGDSLAERSQQLIEQGEESLNRDRLANTARRAEMAANAESQAKETIATGKTLSAIGEGQKSGTLKHLNGIRSAQDIHTLNRALKLARWDRVGEMKDLSYNDREAFMQEPYGPDDIRKVSFPYPSIHQSQLKNIGRELADAPGLKKFAEKMKNLGSVLNQVTFQGTANGFKTNPGGLIGPEAFADHPQKHSFAYAMRGEDGNEKMVRLHASYDWRLARQQGNTHGGAFYTADKGKTWGTNEKNAVAAALSRGNALDLVDRPQEKVVDFRDADDIADLRNAARKLQNHPDRHFKYIGQMLKEKLEHYDRLHRADITNSHELRSALREYLPLKSGIEKADPIKAAERKLIGAKIDGFFPTPRASIDDMLDRADIQPGHDVLEPSAGKGDILDAIRERHPDAKTHAIEPVSSLRDIISMKGHNLVDHDVMGHSGQYDRAVMNPPFENGQDIDHVRKVYDMIKPGGRMVAIMSEGPFHRSGTKDKNFRDWLESVGGTHEPMEEGSFAGRDSFRQTGVRTRMVTIDKPQGEPEPNRDSVAKAPEQNPAPVEQPEHVAAGQFVSKNGNRHPSFDAADADGGHAFTINNEDGHRAYESMKAIENSPAGGGRESEIKQRNLRESRIKFALANGPTQSGRTLADHERDVKHAEKLSLSRSSGERSDGESLKSLLDQEAPHHYGKFVDGHLEKMDRQIAKAEDAGRLSKSIKVKWDSSAEAIFGSKKEAAARGVPMSVWAKDGENASSLDQHAENLQAEGIIRVPEDRNADDYLADLLAEGGLTGEGSNRAAELKAQRNEIASMRGKVSDRELASTIRGEKSSKPAVDRSEGSVARDNPNAPENTQPEFIGGPRLPVSSGGATNPEIAKIGAEEKPNTFGKETFETSVSVGNLLRRSELDDDQFKEARKDVVKKQGERDGQKYLNAVDRILREGDPVNGNSLVLEYRKAGPVVRSGNKAILKVLAGTDQHHSKWRVASEIDVTDQLVGKLRSAIAAGKTVPAEVLADYPDLKEKYEGSSQGQSARLPGSSIQTNTPIPQEQSPFGIHRNKQAYHAEIESMRQELKTLQPGSPQYSALAQRLQEMGEQFKEFLKVQGAK